MVLHVYNTVFNYYKGKSQRLTTSAKAYEDAQREFAAPVEAHKRREIDAEAGGRGVRRR